MSDWVRSLPQHTIPYGCQRERDVTRTRAIYLPTYPDAGRSQCHSLLVSGLGYIIGGKNTVMTIIITYK